MKAIVQRVNSASVTVNGKVISEIGRGLCVLIGIHKDDHKEQRDYLVRKLLNLRVFDEPETGKRWNKSVTDLDLDILCVSQFTLYHVLKGNKPDFHLAKSPAEAKEFYKAFLEELKEAYEAEKPGGKDKVEDGKFGALMTVNLANDGPVTLELEAPPKREEGKK